MAAAVCVGVLLIASAWIGAVAGDHAATFVDQRAWSRCSAQADISLGSRIEGCTTLIDSWRRPRHRKSAEALFQRGRAYYEKGDRERAIADLKRAVEDTLSRGPRRMRRSIEHYAISVTKPNCQFLSCAGGRASPLGSTIAQQHEHEDRQEQRADRKTSHQPLNDRCGRAHCCLGGAWEADLAWGCALVFCAVPCSP
jgi:hypothetical protein